MPSSCQHNTQTQITEASVKQKNLMFTKGSNAIRQENYAEPHNVSITNTAVPTMTCTLRMCSVKKEWMILRIFLRACTTLQRRNITTCSVLANRNQRQFWRHMEKLFQLEATETCWLSDGTDSQIPAQKMHRGKERHNVTETFTATHRT